MLKLYRVLAHMVPILALIVIVKGAYVRLSDAGLGCPDWPGCYGHWVPTAGADAGKQLTVRPLESGKAWREMVHRYLASTLGFAIVLLASIAWLKRADLPGSPHLALLLVPLVIVQGLLGMWTVTLLLKPLIVVAHLIGGLTIAALSWWNLMELRGWPRQLKRSRLQIYAWLALGVLAVQIFLGGWTSSNYAALACTDFPKCQGQWWPSSDLKNAFVLWRGLGINYEFGVLDTPARTAIHAVHRYWAVLVCSVFVMLGVYTLRHANPPGRRIAWCILLLLALQVSLGITNVLGGLPLPVAVMHNAVAALLLLSVVTLVRYSRPLPRLLR